LTGLLKHYKENGLKPKEKKTGGRLNNKKALTHDTIVKVYKYLENYAETHSLALPGRVPGFRKDNLRLLPSSHTKTHVFNQYKLSLSGSGDYFLPLPTIVINVVFCFVLFFVFFYFRRKNCWGNNLCWAMEAATSIYRDL
jgi:hypothetical protein